MRVWFLFARVLVAAGELSFHPLGGALGIEIRGDVREALLTPDVATFALRGLGVSTEGGSQTNLERVWRRKRTHERTRRPVSVRRDAHDDACKVL